MGSYAFLRIGVIVIACVVFFVPSPTSQTLRLDIRVDSVIADVGQTGVLLPVYLDNFGDTVAGFTFWFRLASPDLCSLRTEVVSLGTLVETWPALTCQSVVGNGTDVRVSGTSAPTGFENGIAPQSQGAPLVYLVFDVKEPSLFFQLDNVDVELISSFSQWFGVWDQTGQSIGVTQDTVPDSNLYRCTVWDGDECVDWQQVSLPPYDSVEYVDRIISVLDTAEVHIADGNIDVDELPCGDINGDDLVDLSDLIALVGFLFLSGDPPHSAWAANVNGSPDQAIDLSDLTHFVNHLFLGGPGVQCY